MTKDNSKYSRERRKREAVQRQSEYDLLPTAAKVARAISASGAASRELNRLRQDDAQ